RTSLGLEAEAAAVEAAGDTVLNGGPRTRDIAAGETAVSTSEFGDLVRQALPDALQAARGGIQIGAAWFDARVDRPGIVYQLDYVELTRWLVEPAAEPR